MTLTFSRTSASANSGKRLVSPSVSRKSRRRFLPSTYPSAANASRSILGGHSWLRYLQCHVFARPDFATGGPHGGAPRGPLAGGLHGGGAPHFAMGGTASRRRALTEPRCASERGLAMGGGRPAGAASRWEAAANPWLGAIARCSRTGSSNPSPSSRESTNFRFLFAPGGE